MTTRVLTSEEGVQIKLDEAALSKQAQTFRESLRPFGLDKFLLGDTPERIMQMQDGRMIAEFRTTPLVVWYPQTLNEMAAAGLDVVVYKKKSRKHPPVVMYYVRWVQEISGGNYGNQ